MKKMLFVFVAISFFIPSQIFSKESIDPGKGERIIYGAGTISCGEWIERRKSDGDMFPRSWVSGFISAYGKILQLIQTDSDAMAVFIDHYCQDNPLNTVHDAAEELVVELRARHLVNEKLNAANK